MTQNGSLYEKPFSCTTFYLRYDLTFKVSPYQRPYISGVKRKYCRALYTTCNKILGGESEDENFLDGCQHVYLDMGTNTGIQIRKLYQPHLFPNASVLPIFDKFFGSIGKRLKHILQT